MHKIRETLQRYHDSDASQRLQLYLQYRDLRPEFDEIELHFMSQAREGKTDHEPAPKKRFCPPSLSCLRRAWAGLFSL